MSARHMLPTATFHLYTVLSPNRRVLPSYIEHSTIMLPYRLISQHHDNMQSSWTCLSGSQGRLMHCPVIWITHRGHDICKLDQQYDESSKGSSLKDEHNNLQQYNAISNQEAVPPRVMVRALRCCLLCCRVQT